MIANRFGLTIPLEDRALAELPGFAIEMRTAGYTDFWTSESDFADGLSPLAAISAVIPDCHLGVAILPVQTRGPALMAISAATLAGLAPGRVSIGIGSSSPAIVEAWNGLTFDRPFARVRDMLEFLHRALAGERIDHDFGTFRVSGFRLRNVPELPPQLLLAALRPQMLELALNRADGAITNWLGADDVRTVREVLGPGKRLVARLLVCPSEDSANVRAQARRLIAAYLNVPAYRAFQEWLGRGALLQQMWAEWDAGRRKDAVDAIPNEAVDALIIHGSPDQCRRHIERYVAAGIDEPVLYMLPFGIDTSDAARSLAPTAGRHHIS